MACIQYFIRKDHIGHNWDSSFVLNYLPNTKPSLVEFFSLIFRPKSFLGNVFHMLMSHLHLDHQNILQELLVSKMSLNVTSLVSRKSFFVLLFLFMLFLKNKQSRKNKTNIKLLKGFSRLFI